MAVREALGFYTLIIAVNIIPVLFAFGCALRARHPFIAPRATARPRNVIYNPRPEDPSQNRGNPWFGWIRWVMSISYATMLEGVPGTGTRNGVRSLLSLVDFYDVCVLFRKLK